MQKNINFEKDPDGRWYAVVPEWEGERAELEMVAGADTLCDILAQGDDYIHTSISTEEKIGHTITASKLIECAQQDPQATGAVYRVTHLDAKTRLMYPLNMWLCDVTKFVFGEFPNQLHFSVLS